MLKTNNRIPGWVAGVVMTAGLMAGCQGMFESQESKIVVDPQLARVDAQTVLLQSVHSNDPIVRTNAVEAISRTLGAKEGQVLLQSLSDPAVSVRYAAAMSVGDVAYRPAMPSLVKIVEDPKSDQRVVAAAIYALHRMGDNRFTGQLAVLLHSELDEGRASAATVMGKMGEASAMGPLKSMLTDEKSPAVRLALVEALARLGDARSAQMLESYAKQYFLDLRLVVIPTIGELRVQGAQRILTQLMEYTKNPPQVRVAAAGALGMLGVYDKEGFLLVQTALQNPDTMLLEFYGKKHTISDVERSSLQQIAAVALGRMDNQSALGILHPYLQEQDPAVRVAAAMATLQLLANQPVITDVSNPEAPAAAESPARTNPPRIQSSGGMDELEAR